MAFVNIHPSLIRFTGNQKTFKLSIENTAHLLTSFRQHCPALAERILTAKDELTPYVNIYLNGKNINHYTTPQVMNDEDKIDVVTALVGG